MFCWRRPLLPLGWSPLVVAAVLKYVFFQFRVEEHGVLIRQGVLRKTQLDMRFDRIQGISTEQSLIYRVLGLVTVRFTTAGGGWRRGPSAGGDARVRGAVAQPH